MDGGEGAEEEEVAAEGGKAPERAQRTGTVVVVPELLLLRPKSGAVAEMIIEDARQGLTLRTSSALAQWEVTKIK